MQDLSSRNLRATADIARACSVALRPTRRSTGAEFSKALTALSGRMRSAKGRSRVVASSIWSAAPKSSSHVPIQDSSAERVASRGCSKTTAARLDESAAAVNKGSSGQCPAVKPISKISLNRADAAFALSIARRSASCTIWKPHFLTSTRNRLMISRAAGGPVLSKSQPAALT